MAAKHTDCIITFQKNNGDIIMRPRMGICGLESIQIGDETSMGWKVIDIHYQFYDGNYYHIDDYKKKLREYKAPKESLKTKVARQMMSTARSWLQNT
jgi:hypothetical protein